jgi:tRNA modification GTPase
MYVADTIVAIATPPGRGGIGVVRVSGADLAKLIAGVLGSAPPPRRATRRSFVDSSGQPLDDGIALWFPAPHSYTGEDVLELHGHGGPAVLGLLLARCVELGARIAEPGEFTRRAYLNDKLDLAQAESVADLIDAATGAAARAAARSLSGEFSREVDGIVGALVELRAHTEAALDFPDEEIEVVRHSGAAARAMALRERIDALAQRSRQGRLLRDGVSIAILGAPNVGKSSLLNRLAGDELAIVSPSPGTTRDAIRASIDLRGIPVHVVDTAGVRESTDEVERIGIERTWSAAAVADVAVIVTAPGVESTVQAIADRLAPSAARIVVHNKIDLSAAPATYRRPVGDTDAAVWLSAKTGEGIDLLRDALLEQVGASDAAAGTFIARARHVSALERARACLDAALQRIDANPPALELFAEELRAAQEALSAITGRFSADDLLGEIFGRFCIGK